MGSLRTYGKKKEEPVLWHLGLSKDDTIMMYRGRNKEFESRHSLLFRPVGSLVSLKDREIIEKENEQILLHLVKYIPLEEFCKFGCCKSYKRPLQRQRHEDACEYNPINRACPSCHHEVIDTLQHWRTGHPHKGRLCNHPTFDPLDDFPEDRPLWPLKYDCKWWEKRK